jgi:hypothetical protein
MNITAQQIIYKSLRLLGVLASGEAPTAAEAQDSLYSLNSLIDSFAGNPQYYFYTSDETFTLVSGQSSYAIGNSSLDVVLSSTLNLATATTAEPHGLETGNKITIDSPIVTYDATATSITVTSPTKFTYTIVGTPAASTGTAVCADFAVSRPIRIVGAFTRASSIDTPQALITEQYWNNIQDKSTAAAAPLKLLYRPSAPFGQIIFYPVANTTPVLHLRSERMITKYVNLTDTQFLPPGYQRLLELSLAVELAPEYGSRAAPETVAYLKSSLADVFRTNIQKLPASKIGAIPASNTYTDVTTLGGVIPQASGGVA